MKKEEIEKVKIEGIRKELYSNISSKIWEAKNAADKACVDNFKEFPKHIKKVKELISDIEDLYEEFIMIVNRQK